MSTFLYLFSNFDKFEVDSKRPKIMKCKTYFLSTAILLKWFHYVEFSV